VASGGGLYPYCLYIVSRADHTLQRGVYHYDVAHHALHRVQIGDCSAELSAIFEDSHAEDADILFVLAGRFWQAAFKYGQFAYKVMMQDMGAFLGGMEHVAWSLGWDAKMIYWFKDRALSDLLGLDEQLEAPFFVVSARARRPPGERHGSTETAFAHGRHLAHAERSRHVKQIRLLLDVHSSTCVDDASSRPPPISDEPPIDSYHDTIGPLAGANLIETFLNRETCWGQTVDQSPAFRVDQLLTTIAFGFSSVAYAADVYSSARGLPLLHVDVLVRNVEGLPAGVYRHDATSGKLTVRRTGLPDDLFRRIYRAKEHNTEQMPVALVLTGKLRDAIDHFGQRGIRVMNAEAGMFAQRAYLACSALSLGCGAVLGFDGVALSAALGLDTAKEVPLLLIFVGARRPRTTAFDFRLV
jgi:SagB-type dehydrogenase family enzyme